MDPYGQRSNRLPASSEQKINFSTGTIAVLAGVLILELVMAVENIVANVD